MIRNTIAFLLIVLLAGSVFSAGERHLRFGFDTIGGTVSNSGTNLLWALGEFSPEFDGVVHSISVYTSNSVGESHTYGIYSSQSQGPNAELAVTGGSAPSSDPEWHTVSLTTPMAVIAGTDYFLAIHSNLTGAYRYDATAPFKRVSATSTYSPGNLPNSFPGTNSTDSLRKYSIYASYIPGNDNLWWATGTLFIEDANLRDNDQDTNFGSMISALVGDAGSPNRFRMTIVNTGLKDSIGVDKVISKATLIIYVEATSIGSGPYELHQLRRDDVVEDQTTWNIYKTGSDWDLAGAANTSTDYFVTELSSQSIAIEGFYEFDIDTSVANAALQGSGTLSLILRTADNFSIMTVTTSEASDNQPVIKYEYALPSSDELDFIHSPSEAGQIHAPGLQPTAIHRPK